MDLKSGDIGAKFKKRRTVHNVGQGFVQVLDEKYALKVFHYGDILREIRMSLLAGQDCPVPVLGRFFDEDGLRGFVMPYGQPLAPNEVIDGDPIPRPMLSKDEKMDIIHKICRLMERLHGKGIIHGDLKLPNFLLCSGGEVRLCDWAVACMEAIRPSRLLFPTTIRPLGDLPKENLFPRQKTCTQLVCPFGRYGLKKYLFRRSITT
jgi:serine/threonine protein kinase